MVRVSTTLHFQCDPVLLWEFIENLSNIPKWAQGVISVEYTQKKNGFIGSTFKQTLKEATTKVVYPGKILAYKKNQLLTTELSNDGIDIYTTYEVTSDDDDVVLVYTVDVPSRTWLQWIFSPLSWLLSNYTIMTQGQTLRDAILKYVESKSK